MEPAKRLITADDLFKLHLVFDPQFSPDGRRLACVLQTTNVEKNRYERHLWIVAVAERTARPFTAGDGSDSSPRWSPDGRRIAFIRTQEKRTQIWTIPSDGGEASPITALDDGSIGSLRWSPDGTRLAFVFRPTARDWTEAAKKEREEKHRSTPVRVITRLHYREDGSGYWDGTRPHVWVCDAATGTSRAVTDGDYDDAAPDWSPDGNEIAFISNRSPDPDDTPFAEDIWLVPAEGGEIRKLSSPVGYKETLAWSPDGKWIAFVGAESHDDPWAPRNERLYVVSTAGQPPRNLTASLDRAVGNATLSDLRGAFGGAPRPAWSSDSQRLCFLLSDAGGVRLYEVAVDGARLRPLSAARSDSSGYTVDRPGSAAASVVASPIRMPTLQVVRWAEGHGPDQPVELWDPNADLHVELRLSEPEPFDVRTSAAEPLQCWLLKPPDFDASRRYPLVLYIHGGPHAQYGWTFFHEFQFLAASGFAVLYANPRGSMGRDEHFARAIRGDWGKLDYEDLMAAVDHAAKLPWVDAARLGVAGGSYGGYMTNWIVGHTDRFRCAVTDRSVVNLHSMAGTCDHVFQSDGYWKGNPWSQPETLLSQSPLRYFENCRTPLLIIHSEGDLRCPIGQAEELFAALKRLHREVVFVRYPADTSHGMSREGPPDLRLDRLTRIRDWFAQHLNA